MQQSPHWTDGAFENTEPLWNDYWGSFKLQFTDVPARVPAAPLPVVEGDASRFETPPESGLRLTWLGHSTVVIEIDGHRFLTDPVFGRRTSPVDWAGPQRWYAPPIPLEELPVFDAVLISHDHYDHLDYPTILRLKDWETTFVVPLGVGAHLEYWGVPAERIVEVDWWETTQFGELDIICMPARHASGRGVFDQNATLWAGYALVGPEHRVFFGGDTGLFNAMRDIGEQYGPFDVTMIEVGAYGKYWPDWHIGPEQAVKAHGWLRGELLLPIHWGLFNLAWHGWTEPAERVLAATEGTDVRVTIPKPGESIEPVNAPAPERWWPAVPWKSAEEDPIVSTKIDDPSWD
jgi:L-ascorbate metabolism protein UlaG (beta-lactamase superfamily)